jgi:hypothetical protein
MGDERRAAMLCNKSLSLWNALGDQRGIAMTLESQLGGWENVSLNLSQP